jgi:hypothetical protein
MADDKNQGNQGDKGQNRPGQQQEQQRRGPGSEQQKQGDQSSQHRGDNEREERERKRPDSRLQFAPSSPPVLRRVFFAPNQTLRHYLSTRGLQWAAMPRTEQRQYTAG